MVKFQPSAISSITFLTNRPSIDFGSWENLCNANVIRQKDVYAVAEVKKENTTDWHIQEVYKLGQHFSGKVTFKKTAKAKSSVCITCRNVAMY